jgi:hypothetical protein
MPFPCLIDYLLSKEPPIQPRHLNFGPSPSRAIRLEPGSDHTLPMSLNLSSGLWTQTLLSFEQFSRLPCFHRKYKYCSPLSRHPAQYSDHHHHILLNVMRTFVFMSYDTRLLRSRFQSLDPALRQRPAAPSLSNSFGQPIFFTLLRRP